MTSDFSAWIMCARASTNIGYLVILLRMSDCIALALASVWIITLLTLANGDL